MTMMLNLLRRRLIALSSASAAMSMMMTMTMMLLLMTMNDHGGVGVVSAAEAENLSTLMENNFNDRGNTYLFLWETYSYVLSNDYPVDLTGWTRTLTSAYGFIRNTAGAGTAVVSGLVPGGIYAFKVYQFFEEFASSNPLSVNGISMGLTTQTASMEATAEGQTTADGQGMITFTFTRQSWHVHLSGLAIAALPTGTYRRRYIQSAICIYVCCIVLYWNVLVQYRFAHSTFSIPSFFLYITLLQYYHYHPSIHH